MPPFEKQGVFHRKGIQGGRKDGGTEIIERGEGNEVRKEKEKEEGLRRVRRERREKEDEREKEEKR